MTIKKFEYQDSGRRWKLEPTEFGGFNLLVGLSGAGKTSVLESLREVRRMGLSRPGLRRAGGERSWCIELQAEPDCTYRWQAQIVVVEASPGRTLLEDDKRIELTVEEPVRFVSERIEECNGQVIVERGPEGFLFAGDKLPKLSDTESAISLLKNEERIAPIHRALERVLFSTAESTQIVLLDRSYRERLDNTPFATVDALRERTELAVFLKAYVARRSHPDAFERIRSQYMDIFDSVTDLTVDRMAALDPVEAKRAFVFSGDVITVAIKERGSEDWIVGPYISSGMRRTFFHLAELEFAPRGTVIVIDEYENSMGVNCLPAVTDLFLQRQDELQFILTSHHPYVIGNVPIDWWRVVTRKGGVVTVRPAREIPGLDTRSRQDAFTLLTNSSVFEQGIQ